MASADSARRKRGRDDAAPATSSKASGGRQSSPESAAEIARLAFSPPWGTPKDNSVPSSPLTDLDERRILQRFKMIQYAKNTIGYQEYTRKVPRELDEVTMRDRCLFLGPFRNGRHRRRATDPETPDPTQHLPKRKWDNMMARWRKELQPYIPPQCRTLFKSKPELTEEDQRLETASRTLGSYLSLRIVRVRDDKDVDKVTCGAYKRAEPSRMHEESLVPNREIDRVCGTRRPSAGKEEPNAKRPRTEAMLTDEQRNQIRERMQADSRL